MYLLPEKVKPRIDFVSISTLGRFLNPASCPIASSTPDSALKMDPSNSPSLYLYLSPPTMTLPLSKSPLAFSSPASSPSSSFAPSVVVQSAKELKFRSKRTETKKTLKEEALESLKAMTPVKANARPLPLQALLGGLSAGIIAITLYKFTTIIEASLNRQTIYDKIIPNS
ncbi:unnamed protein product [Lactuca saligna]|uniref:Uncharacterized protein n=1 Tax=Lactuca saligna TaxID=75948 RepID=A0AA35VMA7_LACSI|nr:unnamed protein product [Lactuca saligna]